MTQLESPIDESGPAEREEREAALALLPLLHVWGGEGGEVRLCLFCKEIILLY